MKTVFIHITKSIPLLSQQRFPFVLGGTNYFPVASEGDSFTWLQNQRTGAGSVGGGGWQRTEGEERRYTERKRESEGMGKGGQREKKKTTRQDRKI